MIVITTMQELPEYCYECPCHDRDNGECQADKERRRSSEYRPYWCPLNDVKEKTQCGESQESYFWFGCFIQY